MKPDGAAGERGFKNWLMRLADRTSLRVQVGVLAVLLTMAAVSVTTTVLQHLAVASEQRKAMLDLRQSALTLQEGIGRALRARLTDLGIAAAAAAPAVAAGGTMPRDALAELHRAVPALEWIGFADSAGRLLTTSDGTLEGESVADRRWFVEGARGPVSDAVDALLPGAGPFRLVEIAVPITSDGQLLGVLGARLGWTWAAEATESMIGPDRTAVPNGAPVRAIVADRDGKVLLGAGHGLDVSRIQALRLAAAEGAGVTRELVPGIGDALVAARRAPSTSPSGGLGWTVIALEPMSAAFAAAQSLQRTMLGWGAVIALFAGLVASSLAKLLTRPLTELTHTAQALGETGDIATLPRLVGSRELVAMSQALRGLLRRLGGYEFRLQEVAERNANLARVMAAVDADMADLRRLANTDPLTGLLNRRAFTERADTEFSAARRYGRDLAVLALDVDHFKLVNDLHGHATGDEVIRQVAEVCRSGTRSTDAVGRMGGEEFVVLLVESNERAASICAERLRAAVEAMEIEAADGPVRVTVSAGIAVIDRDASLAELLDRADRALYVAKRNGRNRVSAHAEPVLALPAA